MAKKLMKGCEVIAEAAIQAGCKYFFGYPITPQNDIPEYMSLRLPQIGGSFVQAESEVSAINMVYGASGAGGRVMTSSSSPGISLKQEGISYMAGTRLPCVIVNVMRGGPGLGSIQASQGDYFQAVKGGGHGDYHSIVLAPAGLQETADIMQYAFDAADKYRIPVMILVDGIIGQMMEPVDIKKTEGTTPTDKSWAATGWKPGDKKERAVINSLNIEPEELDRLFDELLPTYAQIEKTETRAELYKTDGAEFILCAYGTVARICKAAISILEKKGIKAGLFRPISLWPFPTDALAKIAAQDSVKRIVTSEVSCGQMYEDIRLAVNGAKPCDFIGRPGCVMPSAEEIAEKIIAMKEGVTV